MRMHSEIHATTCPHWGNPHMIRPLLRCNIPPLGQTSQVYFFRESRLFPSSSPEHHLKTDNSPRAYPVLKQTIAVLGGFALAGILLLAFLSYLIVVVG